MKTKAILTTLLIAAAASADARFAWPYPPKAVSPDEIGHWVVINGNAWPESLARLREHPKVALTIFAKGNLAFTARGPARVVQEPMLGAPMFAAVAIDVENIDDHRQREFAVDSGVSLDWTNERTEQFLQEHLNALREVAATGE